MKTLFLFVLLVSVLTLTGNCATFTSSFDLGGGFHVYGWVPNPQVYGFDYYFSPTRLDSTLAGTTVHITSLTLIVQGHSSGSVVNWNLESFVGSSSFGLPLGQFIQTHIDPVSGYPRTAPIWWNLVTQQSTFSWQWNPPVSAPDLDLSNGLYAQGFFWTADNRNCFVTIDSAELTVSGEITSSVPEPGSFVSLGTLLIPLAFRRKR